MRHLTSLLFTAAIITLVGAPPSAAQVTPSSEQVLPGTGQENAPNAVLIRGAKIFTGCAPDLLEGQDVFVAGNLISRIGADLDPPDFATVIDAGGRVLMPGLIDAHWHGVFAEATIRQALHDERGLLDPPRGACQSQRALPRVHDGAGYRGADVRRRTRHRRGPDRRAARLSVRPRALANVRATRISG